MSTIRFEPLLHQSGRESFKFLFPRDLRKAGRFSRSSKCHKTSALLGSSGCLHCKHNPLRVRPIKAGLTETPIAEAPDNADVLFQQTFPLSRTKTVEGKVSVRLDQKGNNGEGNRRLIIQCNIEGKWFLHWGVTYIEEAGSEWDQPPLDMRPPGSIPIKDYAIETPLKKSSSALEGEILHELEIDVKPSSSISAIHFVLKDEETGAWYQYRGRDFRVPLLIWEDDDIVSGEKGFSIWPGAFNQLSNILLKTDDSTEKTDKREKSDSKREIRVVQEYSEEFPIVQQETIQNYLTVSVRRGDELDKNVVHFDTDIPGQVIVHWGVCRDENRNWEVPTPPYPDGSRVFRGKALQTLLQVFDLKGAIYDFIPWLAHKDSDYHVQTYTDLGLSWKSWVNQVNSVETIHILWHISLNLVCILGSSLV